MTGELRILIAAGATGGHIMPAVAMARAIEGARPEAKILFVGTGRPAEAAILDSYSWPRESLTLRGFKGGGLKNLPGAVYLALKALFKSVDLVRKFRPSLAIATGGYVCGPVGLAVKLSGAPLVIHEQNSLPGLTNRWLGLLADKILLAFPETVKEFSQKKAMVVGNPVRSEIAALGKIEKNFSDKPLTLVILGGSQGSKAINLGAMEAARRAKDRGISLKVIHQTGEMMEDEVRRAYAQMGVEAEVKSFFSDMASVYLRGHLAICRAGALTVFELAACKLPAILVPLPTAADDHQTKNALALEELGLAKVVRQEDMEGGLLTKTALDLLESPFVLNKMRQSDLSALQGLSDEGSKDLAEKLIAIAGSK
ncbi:MAG: undecaprenyldiphospho-muramoylpentapeptide beta-N-acetylglucosaminyltransferase [Deltaproteobacteria bacterium]|jgi:UDP-N-acetylglucosamine--N-acetylmuramyl-(pentapeptide) pyrophosphoryl-undecaprenol N-acetylglucosamine transferase|nr:undecaprenyldiphospho-muramoylpentapeptide beta-N-acetylglucosaminyltransferase [Deltaproteobacteria bacterium]